MTEPPEHVPPGRPRADLSDEQRSERRPPTDSAEEQVLEEQVPEEQVPDELSYERARDELADVVRRLEAGGLSLEESLSLWERGERLAGICQLRLDGARQRLAAMLDVPAED